MIKKKPINILKLALLIILIVSVAIYIYLELYVYNWGRLSLRDFPDEMCTEALEKRASGFYVDQEVIQQWPDACKMKNSIIKTLDADEAQKQIIGLMNRCWTMLGKSEFDPFENKKGQISYNRCFACFDFIVKGISKEITNDMLATSMKAMGSSEPNTNYYELFTQKSSYAFPAITNIPFLLDNVKHKERYAVIFWDISAPYWQQWADEHNAMFGIAPLRVSKGMMKMYIAPYKDAKPCVAVSI